MLSYRKDRPGLLILYLIKVQGKLITCQSILIVRNTQGKPRNLKNMAHQNGAIIGSELQNEENGFNTERYQVSSFQYTNSRRVPLEELDFSIYNAKANMVVFSSTEERMPLWINALNLRYNNGLADSDKVSITWKEEDNEDDPSKCDKISVSLTFRESRKNIIMLNVLVNKGRIQCQGRYIRDWGNTEFPALLKAINDPLLMANNPTKDMDIFINKVLTVKNSNQHISATSQQQSDEHSLALDDSICHSSSQEKPMTTIKNLLANLESDFVEYKQNTDKTLAELNTTLNEKDKEIDSLKNEINSLQLDCTKAHELSYDLSIKQSNLEEDLKKLNLNYKSLEEKNSSLVGKLAALNENIENHTHNNETTASDAPTIVNIPTSNSFQPLMDQSSNETATTSPNTSNQNNPKSYPETQHLDIPPPEHNLPSPDPTNKPLLAHKPSETDKHNKSNQEQQFPTSSELGNTNEACNVETLILCDSNGRHLDLSLLCPNSKSKYIRCSTLSQAKSIITNASSTAPKSLIIHTGTNDLEHSDSKEDLIKCAVDTVELAQSKYPECHIILSSILPRKDKLDKKGIDMNNSLERLLSTKKNVTFIRHPNINATYHLKDKKHLNEIGVKRFAQNLKRAYFRKSADTHRKKPYYTNSIQKIRPQNYFPPSLGQHFPPSPGQHFPPFYPQNNYPSANFPSANFHQQLAPQIKHPYNHHRQPPTHHHQPARETRRTYTTKEDIPIHLLKLIKDLNRYVVDN